MENLTKEKIQEMMEYDDIFVVYAKDKSKESAEKLASVIDAAVGIATFIDEENKLFYGVMISKDKMAAGDKFD